MSGLLVFGFVLAMILVLGILATAFGADSRPEFSESFGSLSA